MPRTAPEVELFKDPLVREALVRILYCWSIRRPASGYVQGINDLVTPFYSIFLSEYNDGYSTSVTVSQEELQRVEADSFWCLSLLLDSIQDNYTSSQSGIARQLKLLEDILLRVDSPLVTHLSEQNVLLVQFAFRWMNCLLLREFPLHMIERLWDTYLSEENSFRDFHVYVCAAFLRRWSLPLLKLEFQEIIMFLQSPPTATWSLDDIEVLLSEAYLWQSLFKDSHHFQ